MKEEMCKEYQVGDVIKEIVITDNLIALLDKAIDELNKKLTDILSDRYECNGEETKNEQRSCRLAEEIQTENNRLRMHIKRVEDLTRRICL